MKQLLKTLLRTAGYEVHNIGRRGIGYDVISDIRYYLDVQKTPVILDIGANEGQTVHRFKRAFPASVIHSFEPSPTTFRELEKNVAGFTSVYPWNRGIGAKKGELLFRENANSDMSSFLALGETGWGNEIAQTNCPVDTVDSFLETNNIEYVDILKSDTQGYEFEVFKGCDNSFARNAIGLLYFEFIFSSMYRHLPNFDEVYRHLTESGFKFVAMYNCIYEKGRLSWCDLLFVNDELYRSRFPIGNTG